MILDTMSSAFETAENIIQDYRDGTYCSTCCRGSLVASPAFMGGLEVCSEAIIFYHVTMCQKVDVVMCR